MSIDMKALVDGLETRALTLGLFDRTSRWEPKSAPGKGFTWAVWLNRIEPARSSGAASTSAVVRFSIRLYASMTAMPLDENEARLGAVAAALFEAYTGDFELGGAVRAVDLLGMEGTPMTGQAGYLTHDGHVYRIVDVLISLIVNDAWEQVA